MTCDSGQKWQLAQKKMAGEGEAGGNHWRGGREAILLLVGRQFYYWCGEKCFGWLAAIFCANCWRGGHLQLFKEILGCYLSLK